MGDTPYSGGEEQTPFSSTLSAEEMAQLAKIDDAVFTTAQWLFLSLFTIADYYTGPQIDSIILSHTHDGRYYTEDEIDSMFAEHAALSHTHDDRYYTESEIDSLLSSKSDVTHNHDLVYAALSHSHDSTYAALSHTHDDRYYTESEITTLLAGKSDTTHNHDSDYADISHTHDEDDLSLSNVTTGNASTTAHGFLKKLPNNAGLYMDGKGNWTAPSSFVYSTYASNQALADSSSHRIIQVTATPSTTITLPAVANNVGMIIHIYKSGVEGVVIIDGYSSETIFGESSITLFSAGDHLCIISSGSTWRIISQRRMVDTGIISRSDWTLAGLGSVYLTHDGLSGTYLVGEKVTEYSDSARTVATGVYGYISSNVTTATMALRDVAGAGTFTNNYYLKGQRSGATSQVNGATKNVSAVLYHMMPASAKYDILILTSVAGTTGYYFNSTEQYGAYGIGITFAENASYLITGASGFYINALLGATLISTQDWWYKVVVKIT